MSARIRAEAPADVAAIEAVTVAAFAGAPHSGGTEPFIVNALRASGELTVSLVTEEGGRVVGHVALSPVRITDGRGATAAGWYGLGPISVLPACQGRGLGAALMAQALAELRRLGASGCVLLGDPAYYERFGFRAHAGLTLPGVPPAFFMALTLRGPLPEGVARYSEAFEATG